MSVIKNFPAYIEILGIARPQLIQKEEIVKLVKINSDVVEISVLSHATEGTRENIELNYSSVTSPVFNTGGELYNYLRDCIVSSKMQGLSFEIDSATTAGVTYIGYVIPGNSIATSTAIKIIDETGSTTLIKWADGNMSFDNNWHNRASLDYKQLK